MKVFVTGVNGQLGHDVILELNKRNIEALASDLSNAKYNLDITESDQANNLLVSLKPDVIIHCAAYTQVDKAEDDKETCYKANVIGTKNLVEIAKHLGSKFIYISTDYVFGDDNDMPHKPDDINFNPLNVYGSTKLEGEKIVSKELSKYYIVRTSWVYGLNGNNFVKTMLKLSETHSELRVVNDQIGNPTNTKDLSRLLVDMALTDKYGYYNATNEGDYISWAGFATKIFELAHKDTKVIPISTKDYGQSKAIRPLNSRLDKHKLKENGFEPLPNWVEALNIYIQEINRPKTVDILLSTYNGEKYLRELLDSLLKQTYKDIHIIIRDDMSTDTTTEILSEYMAKNGNKIQLVPSRQNIGYIASFEELINYSTSEYTCFCDQDDVWFSDKIEKYIKFIEQKDNTKPILICSDVKVVDESLNVIYDSFASETGITKNISYAQAIAHPRGGLGWTQMFNRKFKENFKRPIRNEPGIPHDVWIALIGHMLGDIYSFKEQTGLYRQSNMNTSGYRKDRSLKHIFNMMKISKEVVYNNRERAMIFLDTYKSQLSDSQKELLIIYSNLSNMNFIRRAMLIKKYGFYCNNVKEDLINFMF